MDDGDWSAGEGHLFLLDGFAGFLLADELFDVGRRVTSFEVVESLEALAVTGTFLAD